MSSGDLSSFTAARAARLKSGFGPGPGDGEGGRRSDGSKAVFGLSEEFIALTAVHCCSVPLRPGANFAVLGPVSGRSGNQRPTASNRSPRAATTPNRAQQQRSRPPGERPRSPPRSPRRADLMRPRRPRSRESRAQAANKAGSAPTGIPSSDRHVRHRPAASQHTDTPSAHRLAQRVRDSTAHCE